MKWILASEKMPEKEGYYFCRWTDSGDKFISKWNEKWSFHAAAESNINKLEWLDESLPDYEKDKEILELKNAIKSRDILQAEDKAEIERLKDLIKLNFEQRLRNFDSTVTNDYIEQQWLIFCNNNSL